MDELQSQRASSLLPAQFDVCTHQVCVFEGSAPLSPSLLQDAAGQEEAGDMANAKGPAFIYLGLDVLRANSRYLFP